MQYFTLELHKHARFPRGAVRGPERNALEREDPHVEALPAGQRWDTDTWQKNVSVRWDTALSCLYIVLIGTVYRRNMYYIHVHKMWQCEKLNVFCINYLKCKW